MANLLEIIGLTKAELFPKVRVREYGSVSANMRARKEIVSLHNRRYNEYEHLWSAISRQPDFYSDEFRRAVLVNATLMHRNLPRGILTELERTGTITAAKQEAYASVVNNDTVVIIRPFVYKMIGYRSGPKNIKLNENISWRDVPVNVTKLSRQQTREWLLENSDLSA